MLRYFSSDDRKKSPNMSSFVPIDKQNLERFVNACTLLQEIQHNDDEFDTDTLLNKYRDAIIADCLGFDMINDDKHGWDASDMTGRHFLEVKCVSTSSTSARATFNDTTDEKCDAFAKPGNYLALAVWSDIITIDHIVYGETQIFAEHLRNKVNIAVSQGDLVRPRTQSISESWFMRHGFMRYDVTGKDNRRNMQLIA